MRFGLNFFPSFRLQDMSTAEYYALGLHLSERADALGYASVKTVEHYFHDYGGHSPNPIVLLSAIAARTRRIRLITGAVIPAFNNPIKLAAELAMLDNISNGRLDAGFGRAFIPKEFDVFGVSMDESRARFEEGIDIITRLWTEERISYEGKFHRFHDVRLMPRPVQKPHPPIWIAAVATKESFIWAGRHGYHVKYAGYNKLVEAISSLTAEKMIDSHTALVGTPEEVIEQVQFNRDLIGEHEPSMQINFGGIKEREAFRTLELFAAHVMPQFQTPAAPEAVSAST